MNLYVFHENLPFIEDHPLLTKSNSNLPKDDFLEKWINKPDWTNTFYSTWCPTYSNSASIYTTNERSGFHDIESIRKPKRKLLIDRFYGDKIDDDTIESVQQLVNTIVTTHKKKLVYDTKYKLTFIFNPIYDFDNYRFFATIFEVTFEKKNHLRPFLYFWQKEVELIDIYYHYCNRTEYKDFKRELFDKIDKNKK